MSKLVIQLIYILLVGTAHSYCNHISTKSMENGQPDTPDVVGENLLETDDVSTVHQLHTVQWNETTMNGEWIVSVDENSANTVNETENPMLAETVTEMTANASTNERNQDQHASYWDMFKNGDETGTVAGLLDRILNALNVSSSSRNKYIYITALESPDGSLYVPYNHRQDTRHHLATLLGFAKFVVTNKDVRQSMGANENGNDQAFIDSSKITTVLPTTEEHVTDNIGNDHEQMCSEMLSAQDNVVSSTSVEKVANDCEVANGNISTTAQSDEDSVGHNATTWFGLFIDQHLTDSINITNSTSGAEREYISTIKPENQLHGEMFSDTKNNSRELNSESEKTESLMTKLIKLTESLLNFLSPMGKQGAHNYTLNSSASDMSREELKPADER